MSQIRDLDVENRFSWQSVTELLFVLCGEAAEIYFDSRLKDGKRIPTLELLLDAPLDLHEPVISELEGIRVETWGKISVVLCKNAPIQQPETEAIWMLRDNGNAALIYRAFKQAVKMLELFELPTEFAWCSMPLVPVSDNLSLTEQREQEAFASDAIHTIWLRCSDDDKVCSALKALPDNGEVRAQNMLTANTWVKDACSEG